jgi:hypothetical protein
MIEISKTIMATSAAKTTMSLVLCCINSWGSTLPFVFKLFYQHMTVQDHGSNRFELRIGTNLPEILKYFYLYPEYNLKLFFSISLFLTLIVSAISILIFVPSSDLLLADSINQGVFAIDSKPYGLSYENSTIMWWQWILSKPVEINPKTDKTGEHCQEGQGSLPVFFLSNGDGSVTERTCTVPAGKAILIPVSVVECSFAEQSGTTVEELHTCAEEDQSSNPILFLSVDGRQIQQLEKYRVHSRAFNVTFPENGLYGAKAGPSVAVSDGYWIILEPLPPGKHEIDIKSSLTNPTTGILFFADETKYHLNVVPEASESPSNSTSGNATNATGAGGEGNNTATAFP